MNESWQVEALLSDKNGYRVDQHYCDGSMQLDWHKDRLDQKTIDFCLNTNGKAEINVSGMRMVLGDYGLAYYECRPFEIRSRRYRHQEHHFTTVSLQREYLQDQLSPSQFFLKPEVRTAIFDKSSVIPLCKKSTMNRYHLNWLTGVGLNEGLAGSGKMVWGASKVMELIAYHFFKQDSGQEELFCNKHKNLNQEKITNVKLYFEKNYAEPFSLDHLARFIGCSPSYLSRTFTKQAGQTLKNYLRTVRIRKARQLIQSGTHNVTEAAFDTGYNSLSHFAKAFKEETGVLPSAV